MSDIKYLKSEYLNSAFNIVKDIQDNLNFLTIREINQKLNFVLSDVIGANREIIELKKNIKKQEEVLKQSYEMIDTLAGLSSWDARSEDEINDVVNRILNSIDKIEGVD